MEDLHISKKSFLCDLVKLCNEERGIQYLIWSITIFNGTLRPLSILIVTFDVLKNSVVYC